MGAQNMEPPPSKIPRIEDQEDEAEEDHSKPSTSSFSIRPILTPSLLGEELPLAEFYCLRVVDRRQIGKVIKIVRELPEEFHHLKRVDPSGRVLLQERKDEEEPVAEELLKELEKAGFSRENIEVTTVPKVKPTTRRQSDWARKRWATSFHPNKETEDLLSGAYFSAAERDSIRKWARRAAEIGCVVVQGDRELANGASAKRLLGHPVMEMIQNLAKEERQGTEYLATDCDIFLANEPCGMCAMALVHARAARVFFSRRTTNGVLSEGSWQLHLQPSFNHHYKVFHVSDSASDPSEEIACR